MKRVGVYCIKSLAIVAGALLLGCLTDFAYPVQIHEPPLINPIRGYALAILVFWGWEFFFPLWLSSSLLNQIIFDAPIVLSAYRSCIESLAAVFGSVLIKKLFDGRIPILKSKDWIKFGLVVIPSILMAGHLTDWVLDFMQANSNARWARIDWQWLPAKALGYLLSFPFFAGLLNLRRDSINQKTLLKDLTILSLSVVAFLILFYVDLGQWYIDKFSHRYLAVVILLGVGLSSSPLGLSFLILLLVYLMIWNRLSFLGHPSLLVETSTPQFQIYLLVVGIVIPWISSVFREKAENENLRDSYRLVGKALEESNEESQLKSLGLYSENTAIGLFDLDYRCLELNQAMADIYGLSAREAIGKSVVERLRENSQIVIPIFEEVVRTTKPVWNSKLSLKFPNLQKAEFRQFSVSYIPVLSKEGTVAAVIAAVTPIDSTELSQQEGLKTTLPLAFSHELQEPLRNVFQSLKILNEKLKSESDTEKSHFVENALKSASKMKIMLHSVMEINRLNFREINCEENDLAELFRNSISNFETSFKAVQAQWICDPLPKIRGDRKLLAVVFDNLLSNAFKYRSNSRDLVIRISCGVTPEKNEIILKDNGVGFPKEESEKIFDLFYRLYSFEEKDGYGVGLSISRKIIELHQGEMWAEPLEEGSAFHFTLPVS